MAINFGGTDAARAVLVQPDGRIVLAGDGAAASSFCVARLRTGGTLDTSFGSGGKRVIDFGGHDESAYGAARRGSRTARSCSRETRTCGSPSRA